MNERLGRRRLSEPETADNSAGWKALPIEMWGVFSFKFYGETSVKTTPAMP